MDKNTLFCKKKTINCKGNLIDLSTPIVMGILNTTTDSFYDGGRYTTEKDWLTQTKRMLSEGAKIIDIGTVSTRPNAAEVAEKTELIQIQKVISSVSKHFPDAIISVDTFRSTVAEIAVDHGASIINDISGGTIDNAMFKTIAKLNVPYVLSHIQGTPQTMQKNANYNNVCAEVIQDLASKIDLLKQKGVNDIIIDPGFGFGKTIVHNFELLKLLELFNLFELPLLIGISRKSMIWKTLNIIPEQALNGTTALHAIALHKGADILRVHDVKEAIEVIELNKRIKL